MLSLTVWPQSDKKLDKMYKGNNNAPHRLNLNIDLMIVGDFVWCCFMFQPKFTHFTLQILHSLSLLSIQIILFKRILQVCKSPLTEGRNHHKSLESEII